ncbi:IPT/TIG domain-containing protein [Nocardioides terrisoli]|uniref:IPT/TIG domain-containing protein n=1 Tax=Nocardioides terrisoli TaxID=3388267 RepID=UPI00287BBF86|nr:IPT/TIG domain-containing protein [Nocardioides marmorisolisilvae]
MGRAALVAVISLASAVATLLVPGPASAGGAAELVIIDSVKVGSPVMSTQDSCHGFVDHASPVIPVTIAATFIMGNGSDPTGPYATATWSGGFGSWDDHFGTGSASNHVQFFHILLTPDAFGDYHGAGWYQVSALVQDVGLAGGIDTKSVNVYLPPPSPTTAKVKCTMAGPIGPSYVLGQIADEAKNQIRDLVCPVCGPIQDALGTVNAYNDILNHWMYDSVVDDPPDPDYQEIASPDPPPVLAPPDGLSDNQKAAFTKLATAQAGAIGLVKAIYTTVNRIWGADNAHSRYWYGKQVTALGDLAGQAATALDALDPLWAALKSAIAPDLPEFTVTGHDLGDRLADLLDGLPPSESSLLTQLGASSADQHAMVDEALLILDPTTVGSQSGKDALFAHNDGDLADSMRLMQKWAQSVVVQAPPVVTSVSPKTLPSSGGTTVTIKGANLGSVTGVNFGPSTTHSGQGDIQSCLENECDVTAPPGSGTVDVVAIGPGGPSQTSTDDQISFDSPTVPHVSTIYPQNGPTSGRNTISIFGSGLSSGIVYFGPTAADSWRCSDTLCTATAPQSESAGTVDVTVANSAGTSKSITSDQYTYQAGTPPAAAAPVVTGVSPKTASSAPGQTITVTGKHLRDATQVELNPTDGDWGTTVDDPVVVSDSELTITSPGIAAGTYDAVVYGPGGTSATSTTDQITVKDLAPTITSVTPSSGPGIGGTKVTLKGTGLSNVFLTIGEDGYPRDEVCSYTTCTFTMPPLEQGVPLGPVAITADSDNGKSVTRSGAFTYTASAKPIVESVTPDSGTMHGDTPVVVYGHDLNGGTVTIGGTEAQGTDYPGTCSMTSCVVTSPPHEAGTVDVRVTTHAGTSATGPGSKYSYVHLGKPVVTGVSPSSGFLQDIGDVVVSGHDLTGGTVYVGGVQATYDDACSRTECNLPYAAPQDKPGTYDVTVETPAGVSDVTDATKYTYYVPTITAVTPSSGWTDGSQKVTITGTHLSADDTWEFGDNLMDNSGTNGQPKRVVCPTSTSCTVNIPSARNTGQVDVVVTDPAGYTSSPKTDADKFTYTQRPPPVVTSVSPDHGVSGGGDMVTVGGHYLSGGTVRFGDTIANDDVVCTDNQCTLTSHYDPGFPDPPTDHTVHVTVQTDAGTSATSTADTFTYQPAGVPTITAVSPDHGTATGGTAVTVTGTNLTNASISFGSAGSGSGTTCSSTRCTVSTPKHDLGTVDVTARTAGGTSSTSAADQFTFETPPRPAVTGVDPTSGPASGGSIVTVTGTGLAGATVSIGGVDATDADCTATRCTLTQPESAAGRTHVVASTAGGTSPNTASNAFTVDRITLARKDVPDARTGKVSGVNGGGGMARGPNGDLWFTVPNQDLVGRIDHTTGAIKTWPTDTGAMPIGIARGPDDAMWFTEEKLDKIVRIDSTGSQTGYQVPGVPSDIRFLTTGPDGRLWFSLSTSGAIGAMTTAGKVSIYHLPDPTVVPYHLATGADGRIWFSEWGGDSVGAITTDGVVTEYPLPTSGAVTWDVTSGPDGRLWMTQTAARTVIAVDTAGHVTTYQLPLRETDAQGLTYGPDGRMWFVAPDSEQVSALDPTSGDVTDYPMPGPNSNVEPKYVAAAADGSLWVTGASGAGLVQVTGLTSDTSPTLSNVSPAYGAAGTRITLTGTNLAGTRAVTVGGTPATDVTVLDPGHVAATVPDGSGVADVTITTPNGTSPTTSAARFHYGVQPPPAPVVTSVAPDHGPVAGGTTVTVRGTALTGGSVSFGNQAGTSTSCTDTACTSTAPAADGGSVHVTVSTAGGTSEETDADRYTYQLPPPVAPTLTKIAPSSGPTDGGTSVTITGTGLTDGLVTFGGKPAAASCTDTSCTTVAPSSGAGPVDVQVSTGGGSTPLEPAATYTYQQTSATPTSTTESTDDATVMENQTAYVTAKVTPTESTGTVTFMEGSTVLGTDTLDGGHAYLAWGPDEETGTNLPVGTHKIVAVYAGDTRDGGHATSTSEPLTITVKALTPTVTTLTAAPTSGPPGTKVTFTATVTKGATGWVEIDDNGQYLEGPSLNKGTAKVTVSNLDAGVHHLTATYQGDETHKESTSAPVTVTIGTPGKPGAPRAVHALAGIQQATVTWTAPASDGGSPIEHYVVTPYLGGSAQKSVPTTGTSTGMTVTGLTPGKSYAFRVAAVNAVGTSVRSALSNTVVPTSPPGAHAPPAPTSVRPRVVKRSGQWTSSHESIRVTWEAPVTDGGSAIDHYVVTAHRDFTKGCPRPGRTHTRSVVHRWTVAASSTSRTVSLAGITGRWQGRWYEWCAGAYATGRYSFTVTAVNGVGTSPSSTTSNAVRADWVPPRPKHPHAHWTEGFPPKHTCVSRGTGLGCVTPARARAHHKITLDATGFGAREKVAVVLHSTSVILGHLRADGHGRVHGKVRLPRKIGHKVLKGQHTITLKGKHPRRSVVVPLKISR